MADRYEASIDGFVFDCETLRDSWQKAIARYEYPYRDGADTEDMGQRAREIGIRCYFIEDRYATHFDFIEHIKSRELFEFSHPKYGLIHGRIESVSVYHDDRNDTAEVDISFIQDMSSQETATVSDDAAANAEESFTDGQSELMASFEDQARSQLGAEAGEILSRQLDPDEGILDQISGVTTAARNWLKNVETSVGMLQAKLQDVANPANSLLAMIDYGASLPGRVIGAISSTLERYARLYDSLRFAPERYLQNLQNAIDELCDIAGDFETSVRCAGAQRMALEAADIFYEDEQTRNRLRAIESGPGAFDIAGNYSPPQEITPVLTVKELDKCLAVVREAIATAVEADRSQEGLKIMARDLLSYVTVVKLERDRLVRIVLDNPMPLHQVCLMRGLPYAFAERILAVNSIPNPNFTSGEIDVYVR